MFLCYTHLKEDQTAKSYSFFFGYIKYPDAKISCVFKAFTNSYETQSVRGKGLYDMCV